MEEDETPPSKPVPAWTVWVLLLGAFVLGASLVYLAGVELVHDQSLGEGAATITARVLDTRIMTSNKSGDSFEVQYAFDVGGVTYSYRDATGRTNLWASLERPAWDAARATGTTEVAYLPADPWNNRAVHHAGIPLGDHLAGLCVGLVCMAPTFLAALAALRKRAGTSAPA